MSDWRTIVVVGGEEVCDFSTPGGPPAIGTGDEVEYLTTKGPAKGIVMQRLHNVVRRITVLFLET